MTYYVDASALAKRLRREPGHDVAGGVLGAPDGVATSLISYAETCGALARSMATRDVIATAVENLDRLWDALHLIPIDAAMARSAGVMAQRHRLRGMDAIHLAAAAEWAASAGAPVTFVSWDREQRDAARAEGFALLPDALPR